MSAGRIPTTANSPLTAKGDLFSFSTAPARLAVGSNGDTIVANSSTATGLSYAENYAAGKNKLINGDFGIWQRGTTFTNPAGGSYTADRIRISDSTASPTSRTITQQTFTPGAAPIAGYEGQYFYRSTLTTVGTSTAVRSQSIVEDVRTFAGQTATFSFYAKSDSTRTQPAPEIDQNFGAGGSASVTTTATTFQTTTAWARFSFTISVPSISGKTIGTGSHLRVAVLQNLTNGSVLDMWGLQLEAGSVATAFQTATGTIQGELDACQRYYYNSMGQNQIVGINTNTTTTILTARPPVTMRTTPTATLPTSGIIDSYQDGAKTSATAPTSVYLSDSLAVFASVGYSGLTVGSTATWRSTTAFQLSAEL